MAQWHESWNFIHINLISHNRASATLCIVVYTFRVLPPLAFFTGRRALTGRAITDYMLCAEAERDGAGTCDVRIHLHVNQEKVNKNSNFQGDSGGPLMVNNRGTWELVGLTSWGVDCEQKGLPTMYAAIRREWSELKALFMALFT